MGKLEDKIERIEIMKAQAELTRDHCYKDLNAELRIEKIALSNIIIENYERILTAYNNKDMKTLENLWYEYEAILEVAAAVIYEGLSR